MTFYASHYFWNKIEIHLFFRPIIRGGSSYFTLGENDDSDSETLSSGISNENVRRADSVDPLASWAGIQPKSYCNINLNSANASSPNAETTSSSTSTLPPPSAAATAGASSASGTTYASGGASQPSTLPKPSKESSKIKIPKKKAALMTPLSTPTTPTSQKFIEESCQEGKWYTPRYMLMTFSTFGKSSKVVSKKEDCIDSSENENLLEKQEQETVF